MKKILHGYIALIRELLNLANDGSFLSPPARLAALLGICGLMGLIRNAASVSLGVLPGFYNFGADIVWTNFVFPMYLCLFPAALLHWQLRLLGYRHVEADSIFGLSFHLQLLHLIIPIWDWLGFRLGLPPEWELITPVVRSEWYTNVLYMTPGIILGWWVTAYAVARVLRQRLGIGWFAIAFTSLTTFLTVLLPTYFLFPTLNTLFNRAFGPWLWSPFKYMFTTPKWFPFWGYGTFFTLAALLGLVYYVKRKRPESLEPFFELGRRVFTEGFGFWSGRTSLAALNLKEVFVGVALLSVVRASLDMALWVKIPSLILWFSTCLLWLFYILSLCLATAFLLSRFIPGSDFRQVLTMATYVYWVIPLVPLFSLLPWEKAWGLGMFATIPLFQGIPTFAVERNYLPLGMLVVTPIILWMAGRFMAKTTGAAWGRVILMTVAAFGLIYLYYYQVIWQVSGTAFFDKGLTFLDAVLAGFVAYSFLSQIITFLLSPVIARSYDEYPLWAYLLWSGVPLGILLAAPRVGILAVFLGAGQP